MSTSLLARLAGTALALWLATGAAHASISIYTDHAAFLVAAGSTYVDTYDDLAGYGLTVGPRGRPAGGFHYYLASAGPVSTYMWGSSEGSDGWLTALNPPPGFLTFTFFGDYLHSAGGYFFGVGPQARPILADELTITATDAAGATSSQVLVSVDTQTFVGFVSDAPLTSLLVAYTGDRNDVYVTANDLHLTAPPPIPEPQGWHMLLAGGGALVALKRRRLKRKHA